MPSRLCLFVLSLLVALLSSSLPFLHASASAAEAPARVVSAWLPYWAQEAAVRSVEGNADLFADASPFWYSARADGSVVAQSPLAGSQAVRDRLRARGVLVLPTVTDGTRLGEMGMLLADPARRSAHVDALVSLALRSGFDGLDLDYETMAFVGSDAALAESTRSGFSAFVAELSARLHGEGLVLSVTVLAKTSDVQYRVFDYAALGRSADRVRVMAYDYHWRGGAPGAVAPLWWVERVVAFAVSQVPPGKVWMGVPLYGYDWPASGSARALTFDAAASLLATTGATRQWSASEGAPWFVYEDASGASRTVWYNDAAAVQARLHLVGRYDLGGMAFWSLGAEDDGLWPLVRSYATSLASGAAPVPVATSLSVSGPASVVSGQAAPFDVVLSDVSGSPVPSRPVRLESRPEGGAWSPAASASTDVSGRARLTFRPGVNVEVRAVAPSGDGYALSASPARPLLVSQQVTSRLSSSYLRPRRVLNVWATVSPAHPGERVLLQRYAGGSWVTLRTGVLDSAGGARFSLRPSVRGVYVLRVLRPADQDHAPGASRPSRVLVY